MSKNFLINKKIFLVLLFIFFILGCNKEGNEHSGGNEKLSEFFKHQPIKEILDSLEGKNKLIMAIDINALECQVCYDDFLNICDELSEYFFKKNLKPPAMLVIKEGSYLGLDQPERLEAWKKYNNINFPHVIISDSLFKYYGLKPIMALIYNNQENLIFAKEIPMKKKYRKIFFELLTNNQTKNSNNYGNNKN